MEVWQRTQVTAIMVTHDVDEAILLADRVVMMSNGPNAKVGKVEVVIYQDPEHEKTCCNTLIIINTEKVY